VIITSRGLIMVFQTGQGRRRIEKHISDHNFPFQGSVRMFEMILARFKKICRPFRSRQSRIQLDPAAPIFSGQQRYELKSDKLVITLVVAYDKEFLVGKVFLSINAISKAQT
jgi:hypothetical protein